MSITIEPFEINRDTERALALLADRHRRDRAREPLLPATYEDAEACRPHFAPLFEQTGWYGVVAERGGEMVGFAIMTPQHFAATHLLANFFPPRGVSLAYGAHATTAGMAYDVYREMYSALAEHFVAAGFFDHAVNVAASDAEAREAWESLGFGRTITCAVRDVAPPDRTASTAVQVHQAGEEDAEVIFALNHELTLHHAYSPIFYPYLHESDTASHDFQRNLLKDGNANAHWVGYLDGRPVGMNTFMAPLFLSQMTVPEKTIYLFQGVVTRDVRAGGVGTAILSRAVQWAREREYDHIALHFASANVSGAKFWLSSGFRPIEHGMRRRIDERIAWANR
jgi:GNAT superfamily N-acetyltransferase